MKECKNQNFTSFKNVKYLSFTSTVKYLKHTCPLIFKDASMDDAIFQGMTNVFIYKNQLGFLNTTEEINAKITSIFISTFKSSLDQSLFNYQLFKNTQSVTFWGVLDKIDPFSIIYFDEFDLGIDNIMNFICNNQFFFDTLNAYLNKTVLITLEFDINIKDELLCCFKNFRSYDKIKFLVDIFDSDECSCIIIWIIGDTEGSKQCAEQFAKCNFQQFLNRCNLTDYKQIKEVETFYNKIQVIGIITKEGAGFSSKIGLTLAPNLSKFNFLTIRFSNP